MTPVTNIPTNSSPAKPHPHLTLLGTNIPTNSSPAKPHPHLTLLGRDLSQQSDDNSSYCSSVESVLESRRPDPEAVLLGLGFGPVTRIPHRFLQPSELIKGIDFNKFLEQQGELRNLDYSRYATVPPSPARQRPKSC
ncbi:Ki-ras-induced actin-interacting protein-IP3R-interacting domain [Popillia japonica]|uniref:Ki-ras-induced actin-interacting protein-IP3R-interacting domain n=1 Tax=Popillia japonica TaxID=7064 RepID=A0AAW1LLI8_POPJA